MRAKATPQQIKQWNSNKLQFRAHVPKILQRLTEHQGWLAKHVHINRRTTVSEILSSIVTLKRVEAAIAADKQAHIARQAALSGKTE